MGPLLGQGLGLPLLSAPPDPQLEEEKAVLLGRQRQVEQAAAASWEEQERMQQERLEQEVERQGLEGSLQAVERAREALERQLPELHHERCRLQEQPRWGGGGRRWRASRHRKSQALEPDSQLKSSPASASWDLEQAPQSPHAPVAPSATQG